MNTIKAGSFGALALVIAGYVWTVLKPLITGDIVMAIVMIAAVGLLVCVCGWLTSWGMTQPFKKYFVPPFVLFQENTAGMGAFQLQQAQARYDVKVGHWKGAIFSVAMLTGAGGCAGVLYGISMVLFPHLTQPLRNAYTTLGSLEAVIVSFSSPWAWKVVFEILLPLLFRKAGGAVEGRWDGDGKLVGAKDMSQPEAKTVMFNRGGASESDTH